MGCNVQGDGSSAQLLIRGVGARRSPAPRCFDAAEVSVAISPAADVSEAGAPQINLEELVLHAAYLQEQRAARNEVTRGGRNDAPQHMGAVCSPVVVGRVFELEGVPGKQRKVRCGHIGRDGDHQVDRAEGVVGQRRQQVTVIRIDPVSASAMDGNEVDVRGEDPSARTGFLECHGQRARSRAEVDGRVPVLQPGDPSLRQLDALPSRDVDAWADRHAHVGEGDSTGDPRQRFSRQPAGESGLQQCLVTVRYGEKLGRFVGCGDEAGSGEDGRQSRCLEAFVWLAQSTVAPLTSSPGPTGSGGPAT